MTSRNPGSTYLLLLWGKRRGEVNGILRRGDRVQGESARHVLCMTIEEIEAALRQSAEVRDSILYESYASTVALFAVTAQEQGESLQLAGSGTLIQISSSSYILTAAHVWEEVLKSASKMGVSLPEDLNRRFLMDIDTPAGPLKPVAWTKWGPDIIFLRIPPEHVGAIKAFRVFYNLSFKGATEQQKIASTVTHLETWVIVGAPHASGKFPTPNYADILINAFFCSAPFSHSRNGFDFLDFTADTSLPDVPKNFGGVSGGGLWKILVFESPSTGKIDSTATLEGVAFFQIVIDDSHSLIRCHGPETIATASSSLS